MAVQFLCSQFKLAEALLGDLHIPRKHFHIIKRFGDGLDRDGSVRPGRKAT